MVATVRKLLRSQARGLVRRLVLVLAVATFVLAGAQSGRRFFYCPIAHVVSDAPLCSAGDDEASRELGPAIGSADCCQLKWHPAMPTASTPTVEQPSVGCAGLDATLSPPSGYLVAAVAKVPFGVTHAVRAGPPPRSPSERRAQLGVFLN
jgi:hypothetical protein